MKKKREYNYDIKYEFCNNEDAIDFKKVLERLFKKFLIEYEY